MEMNLKPAIERRAGHPIVIAGPCSAETEAQVMATAKELKEVGIDAFRAGIWKPRTRPGSFEGVGVEGLTWLKNVKNELGLKVTTEVANTQHVFEALKHDIDILWLGARTTVNPFSVQEVADAIRGVDIPVLIKNPINPDLALWKGAIERIYKAGVTRIGVIHRGFAFHGAKDYRNVPHWQIPIDLKREFPDLQIVCDNSHICGRRDTLFDVAQKALDLNFDGVMSEIHIDPDNAWSDAAQQVTPTRFQEMVNDFKIKATGSTASASDLESFRTQIDEIDEQLINLVAERMKLAEKIGAYKKSNNISILQSTRWEEILQNGIAKGGKKNLSPKFMERFYKSIHDESIDHQSKL